MNRFLKRSEELYEDTVRSRRYIHENAEVGLDLPKTVAYVRARLEEYGYENVKDMAGGLTCTVGQGEPCILLRADMDALTQNETTGLPYACTTGACHSCGHDTHTAMLLTAARMLKECESELSGTVKFMFQPGEEGWLGGQKMVEAGILEDPKVDVAVALHSFFDDAGTVRYSKGRTRSAETFRITVHGKAGHGSNPHVGVSALTAAANIVLAAETIPTMEVDNRESAVMSICMLEAGTAENIIPDKAVIRGTIRTYDNDISEYCTKRLREMSELIAATYKCTVEFYSYGIPSLPNNAELADDLRPALKEVCGEEGTVFVPGDDMATEDFAFVGRLVPAVLLPIGMAGEGYPKKGAHDPAAIRNEEGMKYGAAVYANAAYRWLESHC